MRVLLKKNSLQLWLQRLEQMQPDKIELGLDRIKKVALKAGLAQPEFGIITVAGTNGKGSTVAFCDAILTGLGHSTGVYTSPHFIEFNERIVIRNERVDDGLLVEAFEVIDNARSSVALTYFEFTTLAGIYCFSQAKIDVAILEVGLGGRLDAVNAWDSTVACISSIGIDHTDWLGDDRESIGREKAGVARNGQVLVCGDTNPPASIATTVSKIGATLIQRGTGFHVDSAAGDQWHYKDAMQNLTLERPAIQADWACDNAAVAICTVSQFLGAPPSTAAIQSALQQVTMTGRMQMLEFENIPVILDVAHNAAAAARLADFLAGHSVSGNTRAVFACMQDKDVTAIVKALSAHIDNWYIAQIDYARSMSAENIEREVLQHRQTNTEIFASVIQATGAAVAQSTVGDRVVVFGSFHVVGPALEVLT